MHFNSLYEPNSLYNIANESGVCSLYSVLCSALSHRERHECHPIQSSEMNTMSLQTMKTSNPSLSSWEIRSNLEVHSSPDGSSPNFSWHQVLAQFKWEWMHSQGGVRSTNSIKIIVIHSILINRLSRNPICMKSIRKYPQFNSELPGTVNGDGAFVCLKVKAKSSFH